MAFIQAFIVVFGILFGVLSIFTWPLPLFLGIRALRRGGPGARRLGVALLILGLAMSVAAEGVLSMFLDARDSATRTSCACVLGQIGDELASYRAEHGGEPAPSLEAAVLQRLGPNFLICPLGVRYAYRPIPHPEPDDVVAWDSKPHPDRRRLLFFVTAWRRNVVSADGTRRSLTEEEFQALQRKWNPQGAVGRHDR